jgi:hypothetical protein
VPIMEKSKKRNMNRIILLIFSAIFFCFFLLHISSIRDHEKELFLNDIFDIIRYNLFLYNEDHGHFPEKLENLADEGYMKYVPKPNDKFQIEILYSRSLNGRSFSFVCKKQCIYRAYSISHQKSQENIMKFIIHELRRLLIVRYLKYISYTDGYSFEDPEYFSGCCYFIINGNDLESQKKVQKYLKLLLREKIRNMGKYDRFEIEICDEDAYKHSIYDYDKCFFVK